MTKDKPTISFCAKVTLLEIGQFKPMTLVPLDSTSTIAIHVPLTAEYVDNLEEVIASQINANKTNPVWTDKGMKYIYDELKQIVAPTEVTPEDFAPEDKPVEEDW